MSVCKKKPMIPVDPRNLYDFGFFNLIFVYVDKPTPLLLDNDLQNTIVTHAQKNLGPECQRLIEDIFIRVLSVLWVQVSLRTFWVFLDVVYIGTRNPSQI
ncbi:hypothetical protein BH10PSE9_BH10PSE9_00550 [soil metagenome]